MTSLYLKSHSFLGINFFAKVEQHEICQPVVSNLTIFDKIKIFLYESPREKSIILNLTHFWKMPKEHEVALIGFAI